MQRSKRLVADHPKQPSQLRILAFKVRRYFQNRRLRRVATDFDMLLRLMEKNPQFRKHVRQTLRVKGYEG